MNATALWQAYGTGDDTARELLLKEHLGLVHFVARQIFRTLSTEADYGELLSAGTMGLMGALEAFDPSRGHAFSTFAAPRIRGAILDELRRQDHVPRSVRRKTRDLTQARETLMRTLGRPPEDREIAEHLSVDLDTLWRWQADVENAVHVPLDRSAADRDGRSVSPADMLSDENAIDIEERLSREQEMVLLREALLRLTSQERTVLSLYYYDELKLHEIAEIFDLTESRVSQIRSKAIRKLRAELATIRDQVV